MNPTKTRFLSLLILLFSTLTRAEASSPRLFLHRVYVAGVQYQAPVPLHPGDSLEVVAERGNLHDPQAILLLANGQPVGYVPASETAVLYRLLQQDVDLRCTVRSYSPERKPWHRIEVDLWMPLHREREAEWVVMRD